jgi:hypothetical protein
MKESKLNQLFAAVRKETPPGPETGFENVVLTAIRRESPSTIPAQASWLDQIGVWSPRLALACAALIVACVATDLSLNALGVPSLTDGVAQISNDWLMTLNAI